MSVNALAGMAGYHHFDNVRSNRLECHFLPRSDQVCADTTPSSNGC
ncbi:MAG: hypothetical protein ABIR09_02340 [Gallionella sp.]